MDVIRACVVVLATVSAGPTVGTADAVLLRHSAEVGETSRVLITLSAEGLYRPSPPPSEAKAEPLKPLALRVKTRLDFAERVVAVNPEGEARRTLRKVVQAASAINGEIRPQASALRPEVALLVAEPREGAVFVWSPGGPLSRSELELVQAAGDPLTLTGVLPGKPVSVGDRWKVGGEAARCLSAYDALAVNALEATLEGLDDASATIRLTGEVRGAVLGGEGTITCSGSLKFDRKAGRIERLSVERSETRKPGPVEAGLEIKSTLTIERSPLPRPAELSDGVLAGVPSEPGPEGERLRLASPDGKYTLLHDRDWHTYWDDNRQTVLKRLDRGEVVAQCNLATGPRAGKGRHQDLVQLRDDLRRALGRRFGQFLGAGEVDGDPAGGFRYKLSAQGREGDLGVLWYYYLVASPEGDQLLVTFTLADSQAKAFGDQDLQLIGSLRWKSRPESPPQP